MKASKWLLKCVEKSVATVAGTVEQHRMNISPTILKFDSDKGGFFLKALAEGTTRAIVMVMH